MKRKPISILPKRLNTNGCSELICHNPFHSTHADRENASVLSTTILLIPRGITAEPKNFHQCLLKLSVAFRESAQDALLAEQGGLVAGFDPAVCLIAGMMDWTHRDPFDHLLAATAMHYKLPLISADAVFDGIVTRLW